MQEYEKFEFSIASQNQLESDNFLRCLWSQFRANFDNYGWCYSGERNKNLVDLGMLSLGLKHPIEIKYDYKYRGRINNLYISLNKEDVSKETLTQINKCISNAKRSNLFIRDVLVSTPVYTYYEIQDYNGSAFKIEKTELSANLIFKIRCFDDIDCKQESAIKSSEILKLLSLAFKLPIFHGKNESEKIKFCKQFTKELKIIDVFLNKYDLTSKIYSKVIEAAHLYKNGLKIIYNNRNINIAYPLDTEDGKLKAHIPPLHQEIIDIQERIKIDIELAVISLISALEVVASIQKYKSKICPTCKQQIYKIAQRVKNFSKEYGNKNVEHVIKKAYSIRSQIVHAGILLERKEALQHNINPRIDLSQNGKLLNIVNWLPELLLEYVRFILLNFIKDISNS